VNDRVDVTGGSDPLLTAAIIAAVIRLEEERAIEAATPPQPPLQGRWVRSGRPRDVQVPAVRPIPMSEGWSVASPDEESGK